MCKSFEYDFNLEYEEKKVEVCYFYFFKEVCIR